MVLPIDLTDREHRNTEYEINQLLRWLQLIPYYMGLFKGANLVRRCGDLAPTEYHPPHDFQGLRYRWGLYYSHLYIFLAFDDPEFSYCSHIIDDWKRFQIEKPNQLYSKEYFLFLYTKIDNTIHKLFPRIIQKTGYRPCSICTTQDESKWFFFKLCIPIGDKWVCKACQDKLSLPEPADEDETVAEENTFTKKQRAKMIPSLRYSILERDSFKCVVCGRSPLQGDDIKLEVDHIKPIFKGGLTEPDNLQTLCNECNRGKGIKDFWVDPKPQEVKR